MSNMLLAFSRLVEKPVINLKNSYAGHNRINHMGDALETYVKDLFANSLGLDEATARKKHQEVFAYLGNQNNPPDSILRKGDAIEVKKITSLKSQLALNSSYPKDKLYRDSPMITTACKDSDGGQWIEKDIIYAIGICDDDSLKGIWFIYGDCYAANKEIYENISKNITDSIKENTTVQLADTKELARINKVDPLGITYLRVRGMWGIENPFSVFDYLGLNTSATFFAHAIMSKKKYNSFCIQDRGKIESLAQNHSSSFQIWNKEILDPNNPANNIDSVVLSYILT